MTVSGKHQVITVLEQLLSQRCDGHPAGLGDQSIPNTSRRWPPGSAL